MRDHGGRISDAVAEFGGAPGDWLDLSTGINPTPYPLPDLAPELWTQLPDPSAEKRLLDAARRFWNVPQSCEILAASGASALIAAMPSLRPAGRVQIARETYNEHEAAFAANGWTITRDPAPVRVIVRPNNPDGALADLPDAPLDLLVIDESFGEVTPNHSALTPSLSENTIILKSFGKFWGLAGLRLGFAVAHHSEIEALRARIGPWAVSGPALEIATRALQDQAWAKATRASLAQASKRLDGLFTGLSEAPPLGTDLFRLITNKRANDLHRHLAQHRILTRIFPYRAEWIRLGLPGSEAAWQRLAEALGSFK